ncbi:single-stranded DNA-binding protein [Novosphingobium rosa]|jgi:single-strand DNA-binding protein|uniref:single-stranded DNA-binding protein n=1 Tax=Novosphingobium rosa TaxID=76978 RepID=UPI000833F7E6|nr:single-stranded DNA-binding protein [Novosphingobium rosa]
MKNIAEFRIIGRVGKTEILDKVAYINIAANYGRKVSGQWDDDTHWNRVTVFGKAIERVAKLGRGDLIHVAGRVRQTSYERQGATTYGVDLIAEAFAVLAKFGRPAEDDQQDD